MKIDNLNTTRSGDATRLSARVTWEDTPRAPIDIFFDLPAEVEEPIPLDGNAFFLAAAVAASDAGERRIAVDGDVCPRLQVGMQTILTQFSLWYGGRSRPIAIEAAAPAAKRNGQRPRRAATFLTGGIDSLATLRRNRLVFPPGHPEYFRDAVLLYGINFDSDDRPEVFDEAVRQLRSVAKEAGVTLLPVRTNVRRVINPDIDFFRFKYHSVLLGAAAHTLAGRLDSVSIAATHDLRNLIPWGSHPLIDVNLGSAAMRVYHDSADLTRLEKTRIIAGWTAGLQNIKVCVTNWPGRNCGRCEKCIRTMLGLVAVGALDRCHAFEQRDLSADSVRGMYLHTDSQRRFYAELIDPLARAGRQDLADAVAFILKRYHGELGLRGRLKVADRAYFGGALTALRHSFTSSPPAPVA